MTVFSQNDLIQVSRETEVTPGVVVGAGRTRVYGTAPTLTPAGNTNTSGINTGSGGVQSVRAGLRHCAVDVPSELVYRLNDLEWEDLMRDTWPGSEITISATFAFSQAGTQIDGSTGPIITAPSTTFAALYSTADFVGLMFEVSGSAPHADNKWPRAIKDVKADGSQIDIDPLYASALAGAFRSVLHDETGKAGTIRVGSWLRNRGIQNIRSVNFEFNYTDQPGGSYALAVGCKAATGKFSFAGMGNCQFQVMYEGMDYKDLATTSVGSGTTENPYIDNDVFTSGDDLAYFAISGTTVLSGLNLTSFDCNFAGNASGVDDVSGGRNRKGVTVGDIDATGSLKIYHQHALSAVLTTLGRNGNRGPVDWKLIDPAGNFYWMKLHKVLFEPNIPKPGAKNSKTDDAINWKSQLGANGARTFSIQRFAYP